MSYACEIRIPTFRRPVLLERALRSTAAQTFPDWRCIVFDDCPEETAKAIVEGMGDARFFYRSNPRRLGAANNIDQCFRNRAYVEGHYACVLEDDNYLFPHHLETQLQHCTERGVDVTLSAQFCERATQSGEFGELTDEKTMAWIYPEGLHDQRMLLLAVLFSHAFSNGSVFWKLGCASDFEIRGLTSDAGIQETLRMLRLRSKVYISHRPTAVWRSNGAVDSYVTRVGERDLLRRVAITRRRAILQRQIMDYRMHCIERLGINDLLSNINKFDSHHRSEIERAILLCGQNIALTGRSRYWRLIQLAKGHLFRFVVPQQIPRDIL
jgi:glycosyltransferase involved in cell wall biosynthesis